jgi:transposase InsO family protein
MHCSPRCAAPIGVVRSAVSLNSLSTRSSASRTSIVRRLQQEVFADDQRWATASFPGRTQLACYFKQHYEPLVPTHTKRKAVTKAPKVAEAAHETWQMDMQEDILLGDNSCATTCTIRDEYSGAIIASDAFLTIEASDKPPERTKRGRKLIPPEQWSVIEQGQKRFGISPAVLQTDNEGQMAGSSASDFPALFTLRLVGCGIVHRFTRPHRPTDNAEVERTHRTLGGFVASPADLANLASLRAALQREVDCYNHHLASRSQNCLTAQGRGQPPLEAHPELLQPERFPPERRYQEESAAALFHFERALEFLAVRPFQRKTTSKGQLTFGGFRYSIGTRLANQTVAVRLDAEHNQWVFLSTQPADAGVEIARRENTSHTAAAILSLVQPRSVNNKQ